MASAILLVGVLGTLSLFNVANVQTLTTKAREQAVALQREIVEDARSIPYEQLTPDGVVARLQAMPDMADVQPGTAGWQVRRGGITYTVAVGACSVDDPGDGLGVEDATFCATNGATSPSTCATLLGTSGSISGTPAAANGGLAVGDCGIDLDLDGQVDDLTRGQAAMAGVDLCAQGLCPSSTTDANPDDYKRVVVLVRWTVGQGAHYALQDTTIPNPGSSAAPQVVALSPDHASPVTDATSVVLTVTTSRQPASVSWLLDGTAKGTASGSGTTWTFPWSLGSVSSTATPNPDEVLDGLYVVGARAFDAYGQYGQDRSLTMTLNRRAPYPPTQFAAGRNPGGSGSPDTVDFEWAANKEGDIVGYRVYRMGPAGDVQVCPAVAGDTTRQTSCEATGQPTGTDLSYYVVAYDRSPTGDLRGNYPASTARTVTSTNQPPAPPGTLSASTSDGNVVLSWVASPGDPDPGDHVDFYRIYRDGTTYDDRYDRTGTGGQLTYTDTHADGGQHTYRVVAVDTQLAESAFSNAVTQ